MKKLSEMVRQGENEEMEVADKRGGATREILGIYSYREGDRERQTEGKRRKEEKRKERELEWG